MTSKERIARVVEGLDDSGAAERVLGKVTAGPQQNDRREHVGHVQIL